MNQEKLNDAMKRLSQEQSYITYAGMSNLLEKMTPQDSGLPLLKISILRNITLEPLLPVITAEMAVSGFHPEIQLGGYDMIAQEVLDPKSELYAFQPNVIFMVQWLELLAPDLVGRFPSMSSQQVTVEIDRVLSMMSEFIQGIRRHTSVPLVINNFPLPMFPAMGILDAQSKNSQYDALLTLNLRLRDSLTQFPNVYLFDLMGLMARVGCENGIDERYWHVGRAPIGRNALIPFGREYGKFVRALFGKARKCLVLDCDNVLWGGIVGEDGINNIHLGKSYPGSCYQALQTEILNLHDRGIVLGLCSKNNEADVLEVLKGHPDMVLRENNFAAMQINWEDKATNLVRIAKDLNINLDSMVFVDDSPFECDFVRQQFPQMAVLCLTGDPSSFITKLQEKGYFDTLTLSEEDKRRNQMYRDDADRKHSMVSAGSIQSYLANLEMTAQIGPADELTTSRIAQLTQKTNQFNLTTKRYTEADIHAYAANPAVDVFYLKLTDRISDLGLVGVAIVKYKDSQAEIDTFLLSCRVLGRGVEEAMMASVLAAAKDRGCTLISGKYLSTPKNGQAAKFYERLGFEPMPKGMPGCDFSLSLQRSFPLAPEWIKVNFVNKRREHAL